LEFALEMLGLMADNKLLASGNAELDMHNGGMVPREFCAR
jgi:hypothetical protein